MSDQPAEAPAGPTYPRVPLPPGAIPDAFAKSVDPNSPPPMRMMAARAMAPMPPKALVPVIYQLTMDPDPKIAATAAKSFAALDDKLLAPVLSSDGVPTQLLEALCHTLTEKYELCQRLLLNKATPDAGFSWVAEHSPDEKIINIVVENQERLLRHHDIVRGLKRNPKALRSDLDRAIDFMVREGVFLDDLPEFEDSFIRLGKNDMLAAIKKVRIREELITEDVRQKAAQQGVAPEEVLFAGSATADELDEIAGENETGDKKHAKTWNEMNKAERIVAAMTGGLEFALEAIKGSNRAVAVAGINNPRISEADIPRVVRNKNVCEDVIRVVCHTGDWTKAYEVKHLLVQHPKTPMTLVQRWLPLLRQSDLKVLAKSKQIPSQVAMQAKRLVERQH